MNRPLTHLLNGRGAEQQLVEGLLRGDEASYRQLYEVFAPRLRGLLLRIYADPPLVEDAVQATFLAVFENIGQFGGRSALFTWITRIGLNHAQRMCRKQVRARRLDTALEPSDPDRSPEQHNSDRQQVRYLESLIAALPIEKRAALLLFEVEGFSVQEIADVLGEPRGTVLSRLSRTRAELRDAVQRWHKAGALEIQTQSNIRKHHV